MKSKDMKKMRKKLTKVNRADYDPMQGVPKADMTINLENRPDQDNKTGSEAESEDTANESQVFRVEFARSKELSEENFSQCLDLFNRNMGALYRNSSWGLNLEEKSEELKHENARFLLLLNQTNGLAGFVHFRFDHDDDDNPTQPVLYVYEIQIDELYRRYGLGKKLMDMVENVATAAEMDKVMLTVFKQNKAAMTFYEKLNYIVDKNSPSASGTTADYEILSRQMTKTG